MLNSYNYPEFSLRNISGKKSLFVQLPATDKFNHIKITGYRCIGRGSTFAAKQPTSLYPGELGCRIILVYSLHWTLAHGSKKLHRHHNGHTLVNSINLSGKLRVVRTGFLTQLVKDGRTFEKKERVISTSQVQKELTSQCTILL